MIKDKQNNSKARCQSETFISKEFLLRDKIYSARNSSKGALIDEAGRIFSSMNKGLSLPEIRTDSINGTLLSQSAWSTRKRIWMALHYRYFSHHIDWVIEDIKKAFAMGQESQEFISILYLHYVLRDKLTFDFITHILWQKWYEGSRTVSPEEILYLLDNYSIEHPEINKWTESSRKKLAVSILSALRDFGILSGKYKKTIIQPALPLFTAAHILHILTFEGLMGQEILKDSTWKIFLLTEQDIAHILTKLSQANLIHYEKTGNTVVLHTPEEWRKKE